jgi:hypothetical protein|tara:strand:+ start:1748 stop:2053 length:306 start_codon:yes stop_codon:yes gene_type:complete
MTNENETEKSESWRSRIADYCYLVLSRSDAFGGKKKGQHHNIELARNAPRGPIMTEANKSKARDMAANGWTNKRISAHFGVSIGQINRACKGVKRGYVDGR